MGRWSQYDTDDERLPEGMTRIGYDADSQTYTFRDADGSVWESAPGNQFGSLTRVSGPPAQPKSFGDDDVEAAPPPYEPMVKPTKVSWRHEMMPLFNFFLLVGLFLLGIFWYLRRASGMSGDMLARHCPMGSLPHGIRPGDTCWALASSGEATVDELLGINEGLECDRLVVGATICVPHAQR